MRPTEIFAFIMIAIEGFYTLYVFRSMAYETYLSDKKTVLK
jgi:hypothetical protein